MFSVIFKYICVLGGSVHIAQRPTGKTLGALDGQFAPASGFFIQEGAWGIDSVGVFSVWWVSWKRLNVYSNVDVLLNDQFVECVVHNALHRELKQVVHRQPTISILDVRAEAL